MMKHGVILLALTCWSAGAIFAADSSIPASVGMRGEGALVALAPDELAAIEGGDLLLSVDRNTQMMVVTRITPGNYDNIECYSVKVTTAVVKNSEVTSDLAKGAMVSTNRELASVPSASVLKGTTQNPTQFPTGTANLSPVSGTQNGYAVAGPVIYTTATQSVPAKAPNGTATTVPDAGYNIHYANPALVTNTLGCIGVQSQAGMDKLANSLKADNTSYAPGSTVNQKVTVSAYANGTPPPASVFQAVEVKMPVATPPPPAPKPAVRTPAPAPSKPWWKFW